ncbi:hypothetical protein ACH5RR_025977 [Cinchona calisaya]|uniref:Uncharacterized protein n=1 Tax=Cinchona calisaya TaxID=153742 RepID=A0ABD2Z171_9GENT
MEFKKRYESNSGQLVIKSRSSFYFSLKLPPIRSRIVFGITGFEMKQFPFTYSYCFLKKDKKTREFFSQLWTDFFWEASEGVNRMHWKSWMSIAKSTAKNGLGVQNLEDVVEGISMNLRWSFRTRHSLWNKFMKSRYLSIGLHPSLVVSAITSFPTWRRMVKIKDKVEPFICVLPGKGKYLSGLITGKVLGLLLEIHSMI